MENKYVVCGAVEFINKDDYYVKYGYSGNIEFYPTLCYSKVPVKNNKDDKDDNLEDKQTLYYKSEHLSIDNKYKVIHDYMIKEKYTIEESQVKFPELFL